MALRLRFELSRSRLFFTLQAFALAVVFVQGVCQGRVEGHPRGHVLGVRSASRSLVRYELRLRGVGNDFRFGRVSEVLRFRGEGHDLWFRRVRHYLRLGLVHLLLGVGRAESV